MESSQQISTTQDEATSSSDVRFRSKEDVLEYVAQLSEEESIEIFNWLNDLISINHDVSFAKSHVKCTCQPDKKDL